MLDLSRVTCFAIDNTNRVEETIQALHTCKNVANFGEVKLVTLPQYIEKYQEECDEEGIILERQVRPLTNIDEYNYYILYHLHKHINTDYVLLVQDHAFIINPDAWRDDFFDYDYIGAPWPWRERAYITPYGEHQRVGNGGFSLRSKKLLEVPLKQWIPFKVAEMSDFYQMFGGNNTNEDGNITVHNKHLYEKRGCKIAPIEVAKYFSYESPVPENSGIIPFGFHNNLPPGVTVEGYNPR
jgi:hypothetical protein|tara:strand:- start:553 stop:1272 length:720 start_codon:yes stop_codon:yes gene_type:complete